MDGGIGQTGQTVLSLNEVIIWIQVVNRILFSALHVNHVWVACDCPNPPLLEADNVAIVRITFKEDINVPLTNLCQ